MVFPEEKLSDFEGGSLNFRDRPYKAVERNILTNTWGVSGEETMCSERLLEVDECGVYVDGVRHKSTSANL
ncbi:hypothetical protein ACTXT7_001386 [Hymenolepis weldensis]